MKTFYRLIDTFGIGLIFLLLCLFFAWQSDIFFTRNNFSNILIQSSVNIIIATGMTFVICAAEIDLSVGSLLAFCGMVTAYSLKLMVDLQSILNFPMHMLGIGMMPFPELFPGYLLWWLILGSACLLIILVSGALAGSISGFIVFRFGIPSFIVTLGFMMIYRGLARYLTNAAPITGMPIQFMVIGSGVWFEFLGFRVTYSLVIALFVVVVGAVLLAKTRFGRYVLAVGGNAQASYLSGVPVGLIRFGVFVFAGICVSIASIVQTSRLFIGDPNAGEGYELNAIAAVIIGGTSLFGGKGSVIGTCFGALIIGVLRNGLDLMNVTDHIKQIVIGSMIIFAVLLDYYRRRLYRYS